LNKKTIFLFLLKSKVNVKFPYQKKESCSKRVFLKNLNKSFKVKQKSVFWHFLSEKKKIKIRVLFLFKNIKISRDRFSLENVKKPCAVK
jgi:hypothetical protein